jgi:hypothetical protein
MIKIFQSTDPVDLAQQCNDFMTKMRRNLPVRDCSVVCADKIYYIAMVFFDFDFGVASMSDGEAMEEMGRQQKHLDEQKPREKAPGALWVQDDGSITGKFNGESVRMPENAAAVAMKLKGEEFFKMNVKGSDCLISRNLNKKEERHPDFWINLRR